MLHFIDSQRTGSHGLGLQRFAFVAGRHFSRHDAHNVFFQAHGQKLMGIRIVDLNLRRFIAIRLAGSLGWNQRNLHGLLWRPRPAGDVLGYLGPAPGMIKSHGQQRQHQHGQERRRRPWPAYSSIHSSHGLSLPTCAEPQYARRRDDYALAWV